MAQTLNETIEAITPSVVSALVEKFGPQAKNISSQVTQLAIETALPSLYNQVIKEIQTKIANAQAESLQEFSQIAHTDSLVTKGYYLGRARALESVYEFLEKNLNHVAIEPIVQ